MKNIFVLLTLFLIGCTTTSIEINKSLSSGGFVNVKANQTVLWHQDIKGVNFNTTDLGSFKIDSAKQDAGDIDKVMKSILLLYLNSQGIPSK